MKCISCTISIPTSFIALIAKNVCPSCEGPIQTEGMIGFMGELAEALERMPNDAQGVAGWILSNYTLTAIGDEPPPEAFYRPLSDEEKELRVKEADMRQSQPNAGFSDRAEASNMVGRQDEMSKLAAKIRGGNLDASMYGDGNAELTVSEGESSGGGFINEGGLIRQASSEERADMAMMSANPEISMEELNAATSLVTQSTGDDDLYPTPDSPQSAAIINRQRIKRMQTEDAFGAGGGGFRR